jgi:hypothetical protein
MKKSIPWVILACLYLIPHQTSVAATLELPLAITADQEPWSEQVIDFDAGMPLDDLREVRLRLAGAGGGQPYLACMDYRYCCTLSGIIGVGLHGDSDGLNLDGLVHTFGTGAREDFDLEWTFTITDFSSLEDGVGRLIVDDPAKMFYSNSFNNFVCPTGNGCVIDGATLIFEYGDIVPVDGTTWGALKAIYR